MLDSCGSEPVILTRREERRPLEIAKLPSLVNKHAPGTARKNEMHLPSKRCKVLKQAWQEDRMRTKESTIGGPNLF